MGGHEGNVTAVAFSTDGMRIASGASDKTVRVWNAETGESIFKMEGHEGNVTAVDFSPDGTRIVSASIGDFTVRVWNVETGESLPLNRISESLRCVDSTIGVSDGS